MVIKILGWDVTASHSSADLSGTFPDRRRLKEGEGFGSLAIPLSLAGSRGSRPWPLGFAFLDQENAQVASESVSDRPPGQPQSMSGRSFVSGRVFCLVSVFTW